MPARDLWEYGSILPRRIELLRIICLEALCSHDPVESRVLAGCVLGFLCIPCSVPACRRQPRSGAGLRMQKDQSIHMPQSDEPVRMSPFPCLVAPERDALTIIFDGEQATMIPPTGAGDPGLVACKSQGAATNRLGMSVGSGVAGQTPVPGRDRCCNFCLRPQKPQTAGQPFTY